jgi:LmbE family N-acetylglucosaminyl deacetylase
MTTIFLSPHFDDAAYSCGGLIWELAQRGEVVEVWTVCSGDPPDRPLTPFAELLHARWETTGAEVIATRKREDAAACQGLGAGRRGLDVPDCIYRWLPGDLPLVSQEEDLWQPVHPGEVELVSAIADHVKRMLPAGATLVCPMALGNHVDHRMTRLAGEMAAQAGERTCLAYYADLPYVLREDVQSRLVEPGWEEKRYPLSGEGLAAWQEAVAAYASQLSSFWSDVDEMHEQIAAYAATCGGGRLYFLGLTRGPCGVSSIS